MWALVIFFLILKKLKIPLPRDGQVALSLVYPAYTVRASLKVIHSPTLSLKLSTTYFIYLVNIFGLSMFRNPPFSANQTGLVKCQRVIIGSIPLSLSALTTLI